MSEERERADRRYKHLYTRFRYEGESPFTCFYCGEFAQCMDHQPPISQVEQYRKLKLETELYLLIPSCAECNYLLSDFLAETLLDRITELRQRMRKKYKKLLRGSSWTTADWEYYQLEGQLQKDTIAYSIKRKMIEDRLDYSEGIVGYVKKYLH